MPFAFFVVPAISVCSVSSVVSPAPSASRLRWLYAAALVVMIFIASGSSQVAAPGFIPSVDKLSHFLVFGLLATLVQRSPGINGRAWLALLLTSAWGITDEFRQSFTPGRFVEVADWVADTLGAALAVTLYSRWAWYRRLLETPLCLPCRCAAAPAKTSADSAPA